MRKDDEKKGTQYMLLLKTYLEEGCRITETAQRLNMHRNNVVYHINRFPERYHLDLSDSNERLKLQLSFMLLEQIATTTFSYPHDEFFLKPILPVNKS